MYASLLILLDIWKAFGVEGDMQKSDMDSQGFAGSFHVSEFRVLVWQWMVPPSPKRGCNLGTATETTGPYSPNLVHPT